MSGSSQVAYEFSGFRMDPVRRILSGPNGKPIVIKDKAFDTLLYLVEHVGELCDKRELMAALWPGLVVEENNLNQHISALRRALGERAGENRYIVTVPGRGYRFVATVRAGTAVDSESSDARTGSVESAQATSNPTRLWRNRYVLAGVTGAALLLAIAWSIRSLDSTPTDSEKTIAVLAFADLSPSGDQEHLAEGISVDLTSLLGRIPSLRVTGLNSALSFKGTDATYPEIGETLNVDYLVDGAVRIADGGVRVTASLIDAGTGVQVWSYPTETRPMSDVLAIQDEIAAEVAEQLGITMADGAPMLDKTTPEVYSLYTYVEQMQRSGDRDSAPLQRALMERAVAMDPNYFPARFQLALAYRSLGMTGQLERSEANLLAQNTINKAALIWPDRIEIKVFRTAVAFDNRDLATAARYIERALAQDPKSLHALTGAQYLLLLLNRQEQSVAIGEQVVARDPICFLCFDYLVRGYFELGRFDEAVAAGRRARALGLKVNEAWYGSSLLLNGKAEAALAEYQAHPEPRNRLAGSAMAFHALGRTADSEAALAELSELKGNALLSALANSYIGNIDAAFENLNGLPKLPPDLFSNPLFAPLRDDPRWEGLEQKAGISPQDPRDEIEFTLEPAVTARDADGL